MANEVLGVCKCPVCKKAEANVYQAQRKDACLYFRCTDCGLNQGNGAHLQNALYFDTEWVAGEPPANPKNVDPECDARLKQAEQPADPVPGVQGQPGSQKQEKAGFMGLLGAVGIVSAIGGLLWITKPAKAAKTQPTNKTIF